jgi:hypothetical protein
MAAEIFTGSGTNFRIGLYAADLDWQPTGAPLADSGNLDASAQAVKTYTPGTPIYLPSGRYLSVLNADGTPTMRRATIEPINCSFLGDTIGSSFWGMDYYVSRTLAAFPTPGTKWTTFTSGSGISAYVFYKLVTG